MIPARSSLGKIFGDLIERVRFARTLRWRKTDSNHRSRLSRAARSAADQLGKPGEDKAPDEPRQTHKYEQIGRDTPSSMTNGVGAPRMTP